MIRSRRFNPCALTGVKREETGNTPTKIRGDMKMAQLQGGMYPQCNEGNARVFLFFL